MFACLRALALIAFAMSAAPGGAAAIVLWPVDPVIRGGEKATALWIENKGREAVTLQVRTLGWAQAGGEDRYADQDEVIASPPIATVAGGERQLVRIIRRAPGVGERSYRLLIDELPAPIDRTATAAPTAQLAVQMRYSIPLFAYDGTPEPMRATLRSRIELAGGKRYLVVTNTGRRHARLVDLRGRASGASLIAGLVGYVMPGQWMRWALPAAIGGQDGFVVNVNGVDETLAPAA